MTTLERLALHTRSILSPLAALLALLLVVHPLARAATITTGPGCTLIDAINAANSDSAVGTCAAGSGADTIVLGGAVTLTAVDNTTDGDNGLPSITSEMTIDGDGFGIERDSGTPKFRVLRIDSSADLTLRNTTISGGSATGSGAYGGGGILNRGTLLLVGTTVKDNISSGTIGGGPFSPRGGGIHNLGSLSVVNGSSVSGNAAQCLGSFCNSAWGGGIASFSTTLLTIEGASIKNNSVLAEPEASQSDNLSDGGGIYALGALTVTNSTFVGNSAVIPDFSGAKGGGIAAASDVTIINSTFHLNVSSSSDSIGGALYVSHSTDLVIRNSSFSENSVNGLVSGHGGAVYSRSPASVDHVTFFDNEATGAALLTGTWYQDSGSATFTNSIVASSTPGPPDDCGGSGTVIDGGGNFGCFPSPAPVTGLNPTLASNGGPTQTHALEPGSNAINAGGECALKNDQRGISRLGDCDSGAYEYNPCTADDAYEATGGDSNDDSCEGNPLTLGTAQRHLHCDEDWVYFTPDVGKTYEVKTDPLAGADTVVEVFEACVTPVGNDNDGGPGAGSRVVVTASALQHDVRITEAWDSYNPGSSPPSTTEAYDVLVRCIENCDCTPPDGPDLELKNDSVPTAVTYEACEQVTVLVWKVEPTGSVVIRAGDSVVFMDEGEGVIIEGELTVEIDPKLLPPP